MSKIVRPEFVSATIASKIAKAPSMIWAALTHFGDLFIVTVITDSYLVELYFPIINIFSSELTNEAGLYYIIQISNH